MTVNVKWTHDTPLPQERILAFSDLPGRGWRRVVPSGLPREEWSGSRFGYGISNRDRYFWVPWGLDTHRWIASRFKRLPNGIILNKYDASNKVFAKLKLATGRTVSRLKADEFWSEVAGPLHATHGHLLHTATSQPEHSLQAMRDRLGFTGWDYGGVHRAVPNQHMGSGRSLEAWYHHLRELTEAVALLDKPQENDSLSLMVQGHLNVPSDISTSMRGELTFTAHNLLGWMWLLVGRDAMDGITYTKCASEPCTREVPSKGILLPGRKRNRLLKFCGEQCNQREGHRRRRKELSDDKHRLSGK